MGESKRATGLKSLSLLRSAPAWFVPSPFLCRPGPRLPLCDVVNGPLVYDSATFRRLALASATRSTRHACATLPPSFG